MGWKDRRAHGKSLDELFVVTDCLTTAAAESDLTASWGSSFLHRMDPLAGEQWDALVANNPLTTIFQTSAWARVLSETYHYTPFYFGARGTGQSAGITLFEVDSWLTGRRGIGLPFTDKSAVLENCEFSFEDAFELAIEIGKRRKWRTVEFRGIPADCGRMRSVAYYSHELPLSQDLGGMFQSFDPSVRRAIRKAQKSSLEITIGSDLKDVQEFFRLHCITRQKHGAPPQPFAFFRRIERNILGSGSGFVVLARSNGRAIAGAMFFHYGAKGEYKFGASDPAFDALRPNNLVMWIGIRRLVELGMKCVNFGRTSLENEGLRRYKLNWGVTESVLAYAKWSFRSAKAVQSKDPSRGLQSSFFGLCPISVARLLGGVLYPHLA